MRSEKEREDLTVRIRGKRNSRFMGNRLYKVNGQPKASGNKRSCGQGLATWLETKGRKLKDRVVKFKHFKIRY